MKNKVKKITLILVLWLIVGFCYGQSSRDSTKRFKPDYPLPLSTPALNTEDSITVHKTRSQKDDLTTKKELINPNSEKTTEKKKYETTN